MQCLEVPKEGVCALEAKIKSNLRHRGMIVVLSEEHAQREFNNGRWDLRSSTQIRLSKFSAIATLTRPSVDKREFLLNSSKSLQPYSALKKLWVSFQANLTPLLPQCDISEC